MQLTDLKWPDIAALSRDVPIVIPVAALEQDRKSTRLNSSHRT